MASTDFRIRTYKPSDHDTLYKICLQTGDSGSDATTIASDPLLLGHVYCGQYLKFQPEFAFVLETFKSEVCGYVIGALDTQSFEDHLKREWWPELQRQYPILNTITRDGHNLDQHLKFLIHHPKIISTFITEMYPSHFHIDLLPVAQGYGLGVLLLRTLLNAFKIKGSTGVHLGVGERNARAIAFYEKNGFQELLREPGGRVLGLII